MIERFDLGAGYRVSRIIKGGWQLSKGHSEGVSADPVGDMSAFARHGIDTFACADIYTGVEELVGEFLARNQASDRSSAMKVQLTF